MWNTSGGLAAKSNFKQCKYTGLRYTLPLPLPGGIPTTIAYIKGLQAVNRPIFRWYIHTPNKVTLNTRKSILNDILCHFRKQLHQRKSLDRLKSINLLRLIFFGLGCGYFTTLKCGYYTEVFSLLGQLRCKIHYHRKYIVVIQYLYRCTL